MDMKLTVFVRRRPSNWQCVFCWLVWMLLPLVGVIFYMGESGPSIIGTIARQLNQFSDLMVIYLGLTFVALLFIAVKLCLHDRITRGGKERVLVGPDGLKRTSSSSALSIFTDLMGDLSQRQWDISRSSIQKMVVKVKDKNFDTSVLQIFYTEGQVWLTVTEWVCENMKDVTEDFFRELHRPEKDISMDKVKQIPLIKELLARKYPVEFIREI
jgi:hypothetical protein